jgi:hypothetical protein
MAPPEDDAPPRSAAAPAKKAAGAGKGGNFDDLEDDIPF